MSNIGSYGPVRQVTTPIDIVDPPDPPSERPWEDIIAEQVGFATLYNGGAGVTGGAGGPVVTVTSSANSGAGTLRQAIADASGPTWIRFTEDMEATITITSQMSLKNNLTIDGRGANITIQVDTTQGLDMNGVENIILLYFKIQGAGSSPDLGDNMRIREQCDGIWMYHVESSETQDEPLSIVRCGGGFFTIDDCYFENFTAQGKGVLINNTGSENESQDTFVTFRRVYINSVFRHPRIELAAQVHWVNCVGEGWQHQAAGVLGSTSAIARAPQIIYESNSSTPGAGNSDASYALRVVSSFALDGLARSVGSHILRNGVQVQENSPGSVFTLPYSLTSPVMTTALETEIKASAGWALVPMPGD